MAAGSRAAGATWSSPSRSAPRRRSRAPSTSTMSSRLPWLWSRCSSPSSRSRRTSRSRSLRVRRAAGPPAVGRRQGSELLLGARDLAGLRRRLTARVPRDEHRDLSGLLADDDVLRHVGAGETAVLDRVEDALDRSLAALAEVRPVDRLPVADVVHRSVRAGVRQRVAAAAALLEQLRAVVDGGVHRRDRDLLRSARRDRQRCRGQAQECGGDLQRAGHAVGDHTEASPGRGRRSTIARCPTRADPPADADGRCFWRPSPGSPAWRSQAVPTRFAWAPIRRSRSR